VLLPLCSSRLLGYRRNHQPTDLPTDGPAQHEPCQKARALFGDALRRPVMGTARTVDINPDPETVTLQQQELRVPAEGTSPQSSTDVNERYSRAAVPVA
jgi:hypothetical protein